MITHETDQQEIAVERPPARDGFAGALWQAPRRRPIVIAAIIIVVLIAAWLILRALSGGAAAPRYLTAPVDYKTVSATVEETGTVNPVNEVAVGTQVSGTVVSLNVDYNSLVRKGQVLATLDPTSFQAASMQAHGALAQAQSNAAAAASTALQSSASAQAAIANARQAEANVQKAQAAVNLSKVTVSRDKSLLAQGFIAPSQLDTDVAAARANQADLVAAQATAAAAESQVGAASLQHETTMHQAQAASAQTQSLQGQVQQADYNLSKAVITSPIDGIVVSRGVSVGQTVAASFQTPTLFVIASTLKDMQIDTSVSEADVGQLRPGASAKITVPAFPNVVFRGTVSQVRVNPTTVQNVVTYDAIIAVHDESARLLPGMTADVIIAVANHPHVLAIPASALLFKPSSGQGGGQFGQIVQSQGGGQGGQGGSSSGQGAGGGQAVAGASGSRTVVWVLRDGKPAAVPVVIGLNDGRYYEVSSGKLQAGDQVIVGQLLAHQFTQSNPLGGGGGPGFGR